MSGQFSTNLEELAAYHLGQWSGARDHLRVDAPEFELPAAMRDLAASAGPAFFAWQEALAFAPILFVLARRSDGAAPAGLEAFFADKASQRTSRLQAAYALPDASRARRTRGTALDLSQPEWSAQPAGPDAHRLHLNGDPAAPFGYLWKSAALAFAQPGRICIRGVLYAGGLSIGLLSGETWADQIPVTHEGPFEVFLKSPEGATSLIFSNNDNGTGAADATIDCAEFNPGEWRFALNSSLA